MSKHEYEMLIKYKGGAYKAEAIARMLYKHISDEDARDIDKEIQWVIDNCTNVNDIELSNALQSYWYDCIGVSSNSLWKKIDDKIQDYVDKGKVIGYMYAD